MNNKNKNISNNSFILEFSDGTVTSLKCSHDSNGTQFIWPGMGFGGVFISYRAAGSDWISFSTGHIPVGSEVQMTTADEMNTAYTYELGPENTLKVSTGFKPQNTGLIYTIKLENSCCSIIEIGDLAIPMPMNSNFAWGEKTGERVIRHGLISGHGSYLFWSRCDGAGPFLVMTPMNPTKLEYFDSYTIGNEDGNEDGYPFYRAYIHSFTQGQLAKSKGCCWRQPNTMLCLSPGEAAVYSFKFRWADDYASVRRILIEEGLIDVEVIPGMTIPYDMHATFSLKSDSTIDTVEAEHPEETELERISYKDGRSIYRVRFSKLGENLLTVKFGNSKYMILEFFATEPIETLISKRAQFIANHQHKDEKLWYNGLLAEWNLETQTMLGPDNYDRIKDWKIYEVSCDDPGLSKPSFLSSKNAEAPVQQEVEALDYYIENFVWGGLQRTDEEEYAYGIYGIPDWRTNRLSRNDGPKGKLHLWRIYDYPHVFTMYWKMYVIAKDYPHIKTRLTSQQYLERAYRTALAMYIIPVETGDWPAINTGLYNELVIVDIINELQALGMAEKALRLRRHWERKVRFFVKESTDLFGSEYPFDSTGFESTHAIAKYAIEHASETPVKQEQSTRMEPDDVILREHAYKFLEEQMRCNIACRGWLETAYYLLGSDYRACSTAAYTLSYMSQMGGWAILDYALYYSSNPFPYLRLGYAAYLSSWALMNTGTPDSNYGYWYPGKENDGGAGGGFEPGPFGHTWLDQEHHRGSWYYSCEMDLGYTGALRCAAAILAEDPDFGWFCYGGDFERVAGGFHITVKDGVRKRLHVVTLKQRVHVQVECATITTSVPVFIKSDFSELRFTIEPACQEAVVRLTLEGLPEGPYELFADNCSFGADELTAKKSYHILAKANKVEIVVKHRL